MARTLLVIDDDEVICRLVKAIFSPIGFEVIAAEDGASGLRRVKAGQPDIVLLDVRLPDRDGLSVLESLGKAAPGLPVIMLSAQRDVKTAVRATQLGAIDYLTKPVDVDEIQIAVRRALKTHELEVEVDDLRRRVGEGGGLASQMGSSPQVRQVIEQVKMVSTSTFSVLVTGETGTGKELVAQAIHRESDRHGKPFVAVDCGAIPEPLLESELFGYERGAFTGAARRKPGQFQLAEGGTFFLDEVGNLPLGLQAKLLRVLEARELHSVGSTRATSIDLRFIAATNDDIQAHISGGRFRADLFFRLAQYTIHLAPLRDRRADIPYLTQRFLAEATVELRRPVQRVTPGALELLQRHAWPGNVRELRNVVRQSVLHATDLEIREEHVRRFLGRTARTSAASSSAPPPPRRSSSPPPSAAPDRSLRAIADEAAHAAERRAICDVLRATQGNKSQAARILQTDFKTLHVKMKHLGIRSQDFSN